jgi:hypothetical protein
MAGSGHGVMPLLFLYRNWNMDLLCRCVASIEAVVVYNLSPSPVQQLIFRRMRAAAFIGCAEMTGLW